MGLFSKVAPFAGAGIGGLLGGPQGAAIGASLGSSFGAKDALASGYDMENDAALQRRAMEWQFADGLGLTPQEFYGAPAAGGAPSGSGAQVLGNNATQVAQQVANMQFESDQRDKDRAVQLSGQAAQIQSSKIAAEASTTSAGISAGASQYMANVQKMIADGQLSLARDQFNAQLPKIQAETGLTEEQIKSARNAAVMSDPDYQKQLNSARLGVDNTIQRAIAEKYGVDFVDYSGYDQLTDSEKAGLLMEMYIAKQDGAAGLGGKVGQGILQYLGVMPDK